MCTSGDNHALELVNPKSIDPRRPLELVDRTAEEALHVISPIAAAELVTTLPKPTLYLTKCVCSALQHLDAC